MSQRHRLSRLESATSVPPPKPQRAAGHRRLRHRTNEQLRAVAATEVDPDDVAFELPARTRRKVRHDDARGEVPSSELRHWKLPFWKRRDQLAT